jgi:hypothetical protein
LLYGVLKGGASLMTTAPFTILGWNKPKPKIRRHRDKNKNPKMIDFLEAHLAKRNDEVELDPEVAVRRRATQRGTIYIVRKKIIEANITFSEKSGMKNLAAEIRRICRQKFGKTRDQLGIIAADRAQLYYRNEVFSVGLDEIRELAQNGVAIIFIEKEGICETLAPFAADYGIALVNSRGFFVEYAIELGRLAEQNGAHIFVLTDFDASGLMMALRLPFVWAKPECRLGIDFSTIEELGLHLKDVEEKYRPERKHYLPLKTGIIKDIERDDSGEDDWILNMKVDPEVLEYVSKRRIEIDWVIEEATPERFWEYLLDRMQEVQPWYDFTRAVDIPDYTEPQKLSRFSELFGERASKLTEHVNARFRLQLARVNGFLKRTIDEEEEEIQDEQLDAIEEDPVLNQVFDKLDELIALLEEADEPDSS